MPKEIDWDNPYTSEKYVNELGLNLGVSRDDFYEEDMGSQGNFDSKGYRDAVEAAYSNDYSTRRALEAAHLAGEDVPKNIGSIEDAYAAHKWMKDQHGGGGKYSSDADRANITSKWVEKDRENFTNDLNGQMESLLDDALGDNNVVDEEEADPGPVEYSDRLADSRDRLEAAANSPSSLYSSTLYGDDDDYYEDNRFEANNQDVAKTDDQKDGARNFFENSKLSLATGMNLQEDIFNNLSNAANTVTNIYGR